MAHRYCATCDHRSKSRCTLTFDHNFKGFKPPKITKKGAWLGIFQPNRQNHKIAISPAGKIGSTPNFDTVIGPHGWLRGWSRLTKFWFKMGAAAMLENVGNAITHLPIYRFGRNLGGRIPSCLRHVRHDTVAMATAVAWQRLIEHSAVIGVWRPNAWTNFDEIR